MNVIYGEVGSGKTRKLMEESSATGAVIVTSSDFRASRLKDKAEAYGIPIPDPVSCTQLPSKDYGGRYLVDDLDDVLEVLLGGKVDSVSLTTENKLV